MAEISQSSPQSRSRSKVRVKKMSAKIDMTPMVDLAFLLLTFFILTSTFNNYTMLSVKLPEKPEDKSNPPVVNERNVLNFVLGKNDAVYWWLGIEAPVNKIDFSGNRIGTILREKRAENDSLFVLVKVMDESRYENMVDLFNEMTTANISSYAIVEFTKADELLLSKK